MRLSPAGTRRFWYVVVAAVLLGVAFRVCHVERRLFWGDETYTALRVSGHWDAEFRREFNGRVYSTASLLTFQQVDPSRPIEDTLTGLAVEEPHHPPLFYLLDRIWASVAGSSIPSLRAVALLFGVLTIPAVYWLLLELTGSRLSAGCGAALLAVSPFFVNYSGQAREYTLFAFAIAVSSALLLRAIRLGRPSAWILYAVSMVLGLYSELLMVCVLAAHAAYVLLTYRSDRATLVRFGASASAAFLLFVPWLAICIRQWHRIDVWQGWTKTPYSVTGLTAKWLFNVASVLFDAEYRTLWLLPLAAVAVCVFAYAAYDLFKHAKAAVRTFVATLGGAILLQQVLTDVAMHSHGSATARYLIPLWMALLLAVAVLFGERLASSEGRVQARWFAGFCGVLLLAALSSGINSAAVGWWDNDGEFPTTSIAAPINASGNDPLVLSQGHWAEVRVLTHYVKPDTSFLLFLRQPPARLQLPPNAFLLDPSKPVLSDVDREPQYQVSPIVTQTLVAAASTQVHEALQKPDPGAQFLPAAFLYRIKRRDDLR